MADITELRDAAAWQAGYCRELAAPTWAAVIDALAADVDGTTAAATLLRGDDSPVLGTMLWLRFLGAVHRLVLDDPVGPLAAVLPTAGGRSDPDAAAAEVPRFVETHREAIESEMQRPVQTNEVARGAVLSAALGWLGGDLHLREVGASAGLNLWLDRYRVVGDGFGWGPPDAPLTFDDSFTDGTPVVQPFTVVSRSGCDRSPLDVTSRPDRRALRSFVWPDHRDRLARLDAAMAGVGPVRIDACDLVEWVRDALADLPPGRTVVYHSIVLMYLDVDQRAAFARELEAAGRRTDGDTALAHVSFELGAPPDAELLVRRWPEGDAHRLALMSAHGADIRWKVEPLVES
jgi:hypothetical protein